MPVATTASRRKASHVDRTRLASRAADGSSAVKERLVPSGGTALLAPGGDGLVGYSISIGPRYVPPPPPPPPPSSTQTALRAPYSLGSTSGGATADRNSGRLSNYNSVMVGSQQQLASVGSSFFADASVRRVRVESVVDANYGTSIGADWGYASAEVLINLKVLDGTQVKGSNRLSLVRAISAVLWIASDSGAAAYTLSCEFDHSYGTTGSYAALGGAEDVGRRRWGVRRLPASAPRRGPFAPGQPTAHASGRAPRAHGGWHRPCSPRPRPGTGPSPRRRGGTELEGDVVHGPAGSHDLPQGAGTGVPRLRGRPRSGGRYHRATSI